MYMGIINQKGMLIKMDKNPPEIEFICPICGDKEMIPTDVVKFCDSADQIADTHVPPRFDCTKCNGKMLPKFYIGVNGLTYRYENYKDLIID